MGRLWVKVIKKNRIDRQDIEACDWNEAKGALVQIVHRMDLPNPIWLKKHDHEYDQYQKTSFLPDHFMEDVDFQRLEIDYLDDTDTKKRSRDPRNDFGGFV